MKNITLRIPEKMDNYLKKLSRKTSLPRSEIIRQAIDEYVLKDKHQTGSFLDLAKDIKGSIKAEPDLSVEKHLKGYGE